MIWKDHTVGIAQTNMIGPGERKVMPKREFLFDNKTIIKRNRWEIEIERDQSTLVRGIRSNHRKTEENIFSQDFAVPRSLWRKNKMKGKSGKICSSFQTKRTFEI